MTDNQWPEEISEFYQGISLSDGQRGSIAQMRDAVLEARRWKRIAGVLVAACVGLFALTTYFVVSHHTEAKIVDNKGALGGGDNDSPIAEYDLVAVRVHRDWCGKCKQMGNVFAELQEDLSGRRILFLTFDLTDSETTRQSLVVSDKLRISQALRGIQSGNIVLLDRSRQRIETLDGTAGREHLAKQIAKRL